MNNILIESKEWFDRVNGNSYFSSRVEIDGEEVAVLPLQYGYGSHHEDMVKEELTKKGLIDLKRSEPLYYLRDREGVQLKVIKHENCLKRDVTAWGIE